MQCLVEARKLYVYPLLTCHKGRFLDHNPHVLCKWSFRILDPVAEGTLSQWYPCPSSVVFSCPLPPKWTISVNFLSRVTFRDVAKKQFIEVGKLEKPLHFSCNKFLWFPLKWAFQIRQTTCTQMGVGKCMSKSKKEEVALASHFIFFIPRLSALNLLMGKTLFCSHRWPNSTSVVGKIRKRKHLASTRTWSARASG